MEEYKKVTISFTKDQLEKLDEIMKSCQENRAGALLFLYMLACCKNKVTPQLKICDANQRTVKLPQRRMKWICYTANITL